MAALLALYISGWQLDAGMAGSSKPPRFFLHGPTVIAFFPLSSPKDLENDPNANEALADFQFYAHQVREPLSKLGVNFETVYTRSFLVSHAGKVVKFTPAGEQAGYYFVRPGQRPRVEYGVETDSDIERQAKEYFGLAGR
jgi:hypothetical protein